MTARQRMVLVAALGAAALGGLALVRHRPQGAASSPPAVATVDPAQRLESVERAVADRNKDEGRERRHFEAEGWTIVSAPPPDPRVTGFDPALLAEGREDELRVQLGSTSPNKSNAHRIAQILLLAQDEATREHAALALGRIKSIEGQDEIMRILVGGKLDPDDLGRRQLAALLRPRDLDDDVAARMAELLDSKALTPAEKDQVAFTLALVGLRDGMELPEPVLATISPEARARIEHGKELGQRSFVASGHVHSHGR